MPDRRGGKQSTRAWAGGSRRIQLMQSGVAPCSPGPHGPTHASASEGGKGFASDAGNGRLREKLVEFEAVLLCELSFDRPCQGGHQAASAAAAELVKYLGDLLSTKVLPSGTWVRKGGLELGVAAWGESKPSRNTASPRGRQRAASRPSFAAAPHGMHGGSHYQRLL